MQAAAEAGVLASAIAEALAGGVRAAKHLAASAWQCGGCISNACLWVARGPACLGVCWVPFTCSLHGTHASARSWRAIAQPCTRPHPNPAPTSCLLAPAGSRPGSMAGSHAPSKQGSTVAEQALQADAAEQPAFAVTFEASESSVAAPAEAVPAAPVDAFAAGKWQAPGAGRQRGTGCSWAVGGAGLCSMCKVAVTCLCDSEGWLIRLRGGAELLLCGWCQPCPLALPTAGFGSLSLADPPAGEDGAAAALPESKPAEPAAPAVEAAPEVAAAAAEAVAIKAPGEVVVPAKEDEPKAAEAAAAPTEAGGWAAF